MNFWVRIRDLPLRCWVDEAFRGIGSALGHVSEVDPTEARVLVAVNVTKPLKFKKKVVTNDGEEVTVSFTYEKLYRYCFTCFMISHEERDCPNLPDHQKQINKERRVDALHGDVRRRGVDGHRVGDQRREFRHQEARHSLDGDRRSRAELEESREPANMSSQRDNPSSNRQVRRNLYLSNDFPRTEGKRNTVWQRIGDDRAKSTPRSRETSIQSSSGSRKRQEEPMGEAQRAIVHTDKLLNNQLQGHTSQRNSSRRREAPLRIRSPLREEVTREFRRSSRRPPHHQSLRPSKNLASISSKDKGKGKLLEEDDDVMEGEHGVNLHDSITDPTKFDLGSGSGAGGEEEIAEPLLQLTQLEGVQQEVAEDEPRKAIVTMEAEVDLDRENGFSDWAEDEYPERDLCDITGIESQGLEAVPSDWENLVEEELAMDSDKEITEEGLRLMQELENEMILDDLLENDDLLGDELLDMEDSSERTVTEQAAPISHPVVHLPATSQSPSSKRT